MIQKDTFQNNNNNNNKQLVKLTKQTKKAVWKQYFAISSSKVALLSMLLALEIVCTLFSKYVMGLIPIYQFLVLELSYWVIAVVVISTNLFWASMFTLTAIFMRFILGSEPVGLLSMTLIDLSAVIVLSTSLFIIKRVHLTSNRYQRFLDYEIWWTMLACFISLVVASLVALITNYGFIFKLYNIPIETYKVYLPVTFGFTILKFTVNYTIFLIIFKRVSIILKQLENMS
ncbi:ECF transporter S component [Mycoplasma putrefaciens]|uniref:Uncharacterized protein n=1 Tax=Mycoplasma putrefaciens (strain ATCC 15718 / NCTC 10155 / C30 KS-1 / KS-1) TaxID=743965 RepID=A0A7U3ZT33_MYCPK|nr:ECF transporter S component [Mycoplasma putrefaciens]AEM69032.1 uncharacterized protein MPUT_0696 [Mycoplasma putrefaciens KS1]